MSVFISNVDDFISPAQACVNPYVAARGTDAAAASTTASSSNKVTLKADFSATEFEAVAVRPSLIRQKASSSSDASKVAAVSLNDCLACSGCVTSAETVLIQEQSTDKLLLRLADGGSSARVIVTISPQSRASIASHLSLLASSEGEPPVDGAQTFLCLAAWLKQLGAHYVFDTSAAGDIALLETRQEFLDQCGGSSDSSYTRAKFQAPGVATIPVSSTRVQIVSRASDGSAAVGAAFFSHSADPRQEFADISSMPRYSCKLPLLVSHCPGWVCYAEKTTPAAIPFMSTAKSAQQIVGAVAKQLLAPLESTSFYVVSVEPCFDKKLEGSRKDFFHEDSGEGDVDLVISTSELWLMVESLSGLAGAAAARWLLAKGRDDPAGRDGFEALFRSHSRDGRQMLMASDDGGSGGYVQHLASHAARQALGAIETRVEVVPGRNADITEYIVHDARDASKQLKFAKVYGFRNIQSLMIKMKRGSCDLAFVEIMACPGGCVNGGGQLKSSHRETPAETRARTDRVSRALHGCAEVREPAEAPLAHWLYSGQGGLAGGPGGPEAKALLHTRFHAVPKLEVIAPLATKW